MRVKQLLEELQEMMQEGNVKGALQLIEEALIDLE